MAVTKTVRLSKVTKDLNIGLHHIVEFLQSKGIEVKESPNTKIDAETYSLLQEEFEFDKEAKMKAQSITNQKFRREEERREATTITEPAPTKKDAEPEVDESLEQQLIAIQQGQSPEEVEETTDEKETSETASKEKEDEVIRAKKSSKELNIVGTIDLDEVEKKEKKEEQKEEKVEEEAETVAETETPAVEDETETETAETDPETEDGDKPFKVDFTGLSGPNIKGKIELPAEPKKKPVASSSGATQDKLKKKKRKRKEKKVSTHPSRGDQRRDRGGKGKGGPAKVEPTEKEIQDQIKETLERLRGGGKSQKSKYRKRKREEAADKREALEIEEQEQEKVIKVTEFVSASELATMIGVQVTDIISTCMSLGLFVSINQRLDAETLSIVADEFGYKVEFVSAEVQEAILEEEDTPEDMEPRSPIVTVMGHVDHGKTSLLDYIRNTNVISGEAGGITQHIGAYSVELESGKKITFLDTPGHEAFTAMRARGAQVTDVAIIVVSADDSVMPQTVEAINHAQAADVPIVIAINKVDKDGANPEKIKEELSQINILVEDWGGKFQCESISAKQGTNIDKLLEKVLLEAELLELKANPNKNAVGTVIESELDKGRGHVTTVLVQRGSMKVGDIVLAGPYTGRVKALFNERGHKLEVAGPSDPAVMLGLNGAPQAGDVLHVMNDEKEARDIANKRQQLQREQGIRTTKHITLDEIGRRLAIGNFQELNVIIKGDVDGSIEALSDSLQKLSTEEVQINVIHKSVGQISESDVMLASASNAIIIGFQVRPSVNARRVAEKEQIDIRLYSIIYDAIEEVKAAMEGMLAPEYEEKIVCNVEVRDIFKIPKVGTVAGCMVLDGKINRNTNVRVIRDGIVVYTGELSSLKRFKDDVKEVATGYECGMSIANFNDIKVGDIIEGYEEVAVKRTL